MIFGLIHLLVGRESVVDIDVGNIGYDIARDSATHSDRVQPFTICKTIDVDGFGLIVTQDGQQFRELVDGVVTHP